ncbi:MAG TPA: DMT family transporter [Xanthobacteraceae bacterium]
MANLIQPPSQRGTVTQPSPLRHTIHMIAPALLGASSFACADVLIRVCFRAGGDALTISTLRGIIGLVFLSLWLRLAQKPAPVSPRARRIALGLGILFAANVFLVFKAVEVIEVPVAILTYFVYPLLTGIAAAAAGLEPLSWKGALAAVAAFLGLGVMLGAHPEGLALAGVVAALAAAVCRVLLLLLTRATLQGVDPLRITFYSMLSSTLLFAAASLVLLDWQPPITAWGWVAVLALGIAVMMGILGVFASTGRIGPFRTALFMNLEPLLTIIGSAAFLGEVITPVQALGGTLMLAALMAFQLRR